MNNLLQMLQMLQQNPLRFLQSRGFNVPQNMSDPNAIVQYLMDTGQVSQQQYQNVRQMAQQFRYSTASAHSGKNK